MAAEAVSDLWRVRLWAYAPLIVWIGVIFFFSSSQGSMSQTSLIIGPLLQFFFPGMDEASRLAAHSLIRKTAHFTEYAILAFLVVRALVLTTRISARPRLLLGLVVVVLIASIDEFNQSFNTSRTGATSDVVLDIMGGLTMLLFLWLTGRPRARSTTYNS